MSQTSGCNNWLLNIWSNTIAAMLFRNICSKCLQTRLEKLFMTIIFKQYFKRLTSECFMCWFKKYSCYTCSHENLKNESCLQSSEYNKNLKNESCLQSSEYNKNLTNESCLQISEYNKNLTNESCLQISEYKNLSTQQFIHGRSNDLTPRGIRTQLYSFESSWKTDC
jgi:hypothetical protein